MKLKHSKKLKIANTIPNSDSKQTFFDAFRFRDISKRILLQLNSTNLLKCFQRKSIIKALALDK
jgi:hypothetical protein